MLKKQEKKKNNRFDESTLPLVLKSHQRNSNFARAATVGQTF